MPDAPRASARRKPVTDLLARRATLARSLRLLGQFRYEQPDPARFYGTVAEDTVFLSAPKKAGALKMPFWPVTLMVPLT